MREQLYHCKTAGLTVDLLTRPGPDRDACERDLLQAGVPVPLYHRAAWSADVRRDNTWFVAVRDGQRRTVGGFALDVNPSRALPGHLLLSATHLGPSIPGPAREPALLALAELARRKPRVLRINARVFARDGSLHDVGRSLAGLGFVPVHPPTCYEHTIAVDLTVGNEEAVFASLHKKARRDIRQPEKLAMTVRPIEDAAHYGPRIDQLLAEALQRTGGTHRAKDWAGPIALSRTRPELSRLVGLFRAAPGGGPDELLAFAWGMHHGDHAEYNASGSVRLPDANVALSYALLWDLIRWAKASGARWFDMGGVTLQAPPGSADPLEGISDFKRYFSRDVAEVGREWVLEPSPVRASLAKAVSATASWFSSRGGAAAPEARAPRPEVSCPTP